MTISPFRPSFNLNGELGNVFYYLDRAIYSIENERFSEHPIQSRIRLNKEAYQESDE